MNQSITDRVTSELREEIAESVRHFWQKNQQPAGVCLSDQNVALLRRSSGGMGTTFLGIPIYRLRQDSSTQWCVVSREELERQSKANEILPLFRFTDLTDIATEMVVLKNKLGQAGLFKTMRLMDEATRAIGYEIADKELRG